MEEKLKSILRRIHWSLLLKAAVFAAAWAIAPFWLFVVIALYLYFVPIAQSRSVVIPFLILLAISALEPVGFFLAFVFGAAFLYILLIKDLYLVDRRSAYEVLVIFLSFFILRDFYLHFGGTVSEGTLFMAFLVAAILGGLDASFVRTFFDEVSPESRLLRNTACLLLALLTWQFLIAGLFLPVDFVYQATIVLIIVVFFVDLIPQYLFGEMNRVKLLTTSSVVFGLLAIVLSSARWGL